MAGPGMESTDGADIVPGLARLAQRLVAPGMQRRMESSGVSEECALIVVEAHISPLTTRAMPGREPHRAGHQLGRSPLTPPRIVRLGHASDRPQPHCQPGACAAAQIVAPLRRLQSWQSNCRLRAVFDPPFENGMM